MKAPRLIPLFLWSLFALTNLHAFDWQAARQDWGAVTVAAMELHPLEVSKEDYDSWTAVPAKLQQLHALIFKSPKKDNSGVIDYQVTKDGWVLLAGHFGKEGSSGDWLKERWEAKDLVKDGWVQLTAEETGGPLVDQGNSTFDIFAKRVKAGTNGRMRLNKHTLPHFILLGGAGNNLPASAGRDISDLVKTHRNNLVFVTGTNGAGSGFVAKFGGATFLFTNAHVAAGVKGAAFKTLDGAQVQAGAASVAVDHDILRLTVSPGPNPFPVMEHVGENANIGDEVAVLGNAEGAGVINIIKGHIVGIGPNLVEVDAPFVPGNSGSPIIHLKSGQVIAVATYALIKRYDAETMKAPQKPVVRRFGYRLDSVKTWQPVTWNTFAAQAAEMEAVEKLTEDLGGFLSDLEKNHRVTPGLHTNPALKTTIDRWLANRSHQLSPSDRAAADQNFIGTIKSACQNDVLAIRPHLTYDYFQRAMADEQRNRDSIAGVPDKILQEIPGL